MTAIASPQLVDAPPWIASLPVEARGYYVPAETPWIDGRPYLAAVGEVNKLALAFNRACAVCGFALPPGRPVYRGFAQSDAATIRLRERTFSSDISGPGHKSCMLYSAIACPHMTHPTSRLGKDSKIAPGARRGIRAAVLGFENFVLLVPAFDASNDGTAFQFGYERLCDDIHYKYGSELVGRFVEAVAADASHIDTTAVRSMWTENEDAETGPMAEHVKAGLQRLARHRGEPSVMSVGRPYISASVPL